MREISPQRAQRTRGDCAAWVADMSAVPGFFVLFVSFVANRLSKLALPAFRRRGAPGRKSIRIGSESEELPRLHHVRGKRRGTLQSATIGVRNVDRARMKM